MRPQPRMQNKKAYERSHHGHTGNHPAFPAQWFYGLLRALPGDQALLAPSPARLLADLTPTLGRQNHTTSPYAPAPFVKGAAASTASRPASVTIAKRPSEGRDGKGYITDLGLLASEISEFPKPFEALQSVEISRDSRLEDTYRAAQRDAEHAGREM